MKSIAIIGVRGIPVVYSGFETFAEELAVRLVKRNWRVVVFCRRHVVSRGMTSYKGVKLISLPSIPTRSLDTITHSVISTLYACLMKPRLEIIYYLGVGSSICSFIPRLFGIKTVVNVDGLDWKRGKWGRLASWFLHVSEKLAITLANLAMTDSDYIQKYYRRVYKAAMPVIPYGYSKMRVGEELIKQYGLKRDLYLIWTGRLVPDNHLDELLKAYRSARIKMPLIVLGDSPNEDTYKQYLYALAKGLSVKFLGFVGRESYGSLVAHSRAYIETKRSGGTHPSLVESMGHGCLILANDHSSHKDVLGETARYYKKGEISDLARELRVICKPAFDKEKMRLGQIAKQRAVKKYSWTSVVDNYEILFAKLTAS